MPSLFVGPTGNADTAFAHYVKSLLNTRDASLSPAVRASPLYGAILRHNHSIQQINESQPRESVPSRPVREASNGPIVPLALTRRGVGPRDPLLQRKLKKQQRQEKEQEKDAVDSTDADRLSQHWSRRALQEMTSTGWEVFRAQVGIQIEVVSRRSSSPSLSVPSTRFGSDVTRPARCWEEAQLPLSIGTIVSRRFPIPSPIQSQCVPLALAVVESTPSGRVDVLGVAETGSGKTAAYLIPALSHILLHCPRLLHNAELISHGPFALVVVPTRELAEQVAREANALIGGVINEEEMRQLEAAECAGDLTTGNGNERRNVLRELRVVKVVGGEQMEAQYESLAKGAHLVIGTLGQLDALLQQRLLALGNTKFVVLDEADRMIEEHQTETLVAVLERCPLPRQTLMFTATLSAACEEVALKYFSPVGFVTVRVPPRCAGITQVLELIPSDTARHASNAESNTSHRRQNHPLIHPIKFARLVNYLVYATPPVVVFANEKRTCDALQDELRAEAEHLAGLSDSFSLTALVGECPQVLQSLRRPVGGLNGLRSTALVHSELSQSERRRLVELFHKGERRVLITTDLLARGLDVPNVSLVLNYDMPRPVHDGGHHTNQNGGGNEEAVQKYIHRIGRTGRAGATGVAVSFISLSSSLIRRAQQHVTRRIHKEAEDTQKPISFATTSAKAMASAADRRALTDAKGNGTGRAANDAFLLHEDSASEGDEARSSDDASEREKESPTRSHGTGNGRGAEPPRVRARVESTVPFPSDESILSSLWAFLVRCAEAAGSGAEGIRQQRCPQLQVPPALAALMVAFTQRSPHGSITQ